MQKLKISFLVTLSICFNISFSQKAITVNYGINYSIISVNADYKKIGLPGFKASIDYKFLETKHFIPSIEFAISEKRGEIQDIHYQIIGKEINSHSFYNISLETPLKLQLNIFRFFVNISGGLEFSCYTDSKLYDDNKNLFYHDKLFRYQAVHSIYSIGIGLNFNRVFRSLAISFFKSNNVLYKSRYNEIKINYVSISLSSLIFKNTKNENKNIDVINNSK